MLPFPWEQHFRHFRGSWTPQPSSPPGRPCSARSGAFHYLTRALGDSFRTSKSRLRPWERQEEEEPSCGEQRALSGRCLCRLRAAGNLGQGWERRVLPGPHPPRRARLEAPWARASASPEKLLPLFQAGPAERPSQSFFFRVHVLGRGWDFRF